MTYTQVRLYGVVSLLGFTLSNVQSWWSSYDETGTKLYAGSNTYNLSLLAGRAAFASDMQSAMDLTFGTTSSGTVTLSGTNLTIDISGTISSGSPVPVLCVALQDNATFFVSDLLGTIPT